VCGGAATPLREQTLHLVFLRDLFPDCPCFLDPLKLLKATTAACMLPFRLALAGAAAVRSGCWAVESCGQGRGPPSAAAPVTRGARRSQISMSVHFATSHFSATHHLDIIITGMVITMPRLLRDESLLRGVRAVLLRLLFLLRRVVRGCGNQAYVSVLRHKRRTIKVPAVVQLVVYRYVAW
jgi:hypothetical protein